MAKLIQDFEKRDLLIQSMMSLSMNRQQAEQAADRIMRKERAAAPSPPPPPSESVPPVKRPKAKRAPKPKQMPAPEPAPLAPEPVVQLMTPPQQEIQDDLLTVAQVAKITGLAPECLANRRYRNSPPAFVKEDNRVFYPRSAVDAFMGAGFFPVDSDLVDTDEAAEILGVRPTLLRSWRTSGEGPRLWLRGRSRKVFYLKMEIEALAVTQRKKSMIAWANAENQPEEQHPLTAMQRSALAQIAARALALGVSDRELARLVFGKYSRSYQLSLEKMLVNRDPLLSTLVQYAEALDCTLELNFVPKQQKKEKK